MSQRASTNLIINYLPQSLTDEEFRSMFLSIGPLKASKIVRDRNTNYSYGFGFVDYMNEDDAAKAIATLNGLQLQNKRIKVAYSRNGDKVKGANLYVKNLSRTLTQEQLQDMFSPYGSIIQARIILDQNTAQSKGVGFVLYDTRDQAEKAIATLDGHIPAGATEAIYVKYADDNAGKARPPTGGTAAAAAAAAARGGYNGGGYGARGGYASYGPVRNRAGLNRYNPMSGTYSSGAYAGFAEGYHQNGGTGGGGDAGFVLFVYNIGPDTDERALWQLFSPFGTIGKVNVMRDFQKNMGKGYGFVTMSSYHEALNAIQQLNGYKYYGKPLQVSFKTSKN